MIIRYKRVEWSGFGASVVYTWRCPVCTKCTWPQTREEHTDQHNADVDQRMQLRSDHAKEAGPEAL